MKRLALALVVAGCLPQRPATEVIVTVDSAFGVPCTIDTLHVEITGSGETVTQDIPITDADLPGSITLAPAGDPSTVTVTVVGMREGEAFATARDEVTFDEHRSVELRMVLDQACVPGPCPAVGVGDYAGLPERHARRGCGAAAYAIQSSIFAMRDACDMPEGIPNTVLVDSDEGEAMSPLPEGMPFPFHYYGEPVSQLWVGSNGYLTFGPNKPAALTVDIGGSESLGEPGFPTGGVLPFWDDLRTGRRGVCFAVSGEAPNRLLWITWKEACFAVGPSGRFGCGDPAQGTLTFSLALEETSDAIYVAYHTLQATGSNADRALGATATIGLTSGERTCTADRCDANGACAGGAACGYTEYSFARKPELGSTLVLVPR